MTKAELTRLMAWRWRVLRHAGEEGNVARTCRRFGISRKSFYKWKRRLEQHGEAGLCDRPRTPQRSSPSHGSHTARLRLSLDRFSVEVETLALGAFPLHLR
jgi:transposase-like protein